MKKNILFILNGGLTAALLLASPLAVMGEDTENPEEQEIRHIVVEARKNAEEWASRVREYALSGEETKSTYMGVAVESIPSVLRDYVDLPKGVGLLLPRINEDGPAAKAGLMDNDILVKFDGQLVINYNQFSTLVEMHEPGDEVSLLVMRKGKEMEFEVTLEERVRKGMRWFHSDMPRVPDVPAAPDLPDVGALMEQVDEWIPGSVRVFIDENHEVHVDLDDLKNDLEGLRTKLAKIRVVGDTDVDNIVVKHGDEGARTTTIHIADKDVNFVSEKGRVEISSTGEEKYARIMNASGELLYEGPIPEDYAEKLPPEAVELLNELESIEFDTMEKWEVELNTEGVEPVTMSYPQG